MDYLPLFFSLRDKPVLLVGGGAVALRKARLLAAAGARLTVVAPAIEPDLQALLDRGGGRWQQDSYSPQDGDRARHLQGQTLVVAATPVRAVNSAVAEDAQHRALPVNVVDDPALCSVVFPAIIDRSPLLVAIGSGGHSPVLARLLRGKIEALLPAAYGRLARFAGRFRGAVKGALPDADQRRRFWERVLSGPLAERVLAGQEAEASAQLQAQLDGIAVGSAATDANNDTAGNNAGINNNDAENGADGKTIASAAGQGIAAKEKGEVYLIGAGPGDPDLLTLKAARLLQQAEVVLHDRLVTPAVLDMARRDAERIYVGKRRADHSLPQGQINQMLLDLARQGKRVARLKGGDPFIFGRGGEELELLTEHAIPFQIVPGITAASGCACYAGIPLTHRDHAQSVRFLTGQSRDNRVDLPWDELVSGGQTLVFYMGLQGLGDICQGLQDHGLGGDTPAALVEQGTTPNQRTLVATLATLEAAVAARGAHAPTLLIVGAVVSLRGQLAWYGEAESPTPWPPDGAFPTSGPDTG